MKKKGKNRLRRALAVFMTVFLMMGMMPQAALADTVADDGGVVAEEQQPQSGEQQAGGETPGTTAGDAELPDETDGGLVDVSANQIQAETGGQQDSDLMRQAAADAALLGSDGSSETEHETVGGTVYLSVSYDGKYINGQNGAPIAYVPVPLNEIAAIDLEEYELGDYLYDEDQDGTYDITALQLVIYAHEMIYGGSWSDVTFTGGAGSSYFQGGIFGFDENLNYYLNGEYPLIGEGWGATSDQIVLEAGDFVDIGSFSSWNFFSDSNYGFHFFADGNGMFTHDYTVEAGDELPVKLVRSYSGMGSAATVFDAGDYEISYGMAYGDTTGTAVTDGSGCAAITFEEAGTYYLWADGGYGLEFPDDIVSTPGYATVTVTEPEQGGGEQPGTTEPDTENTGTVYISASEEDQFINDQNGNPVAYKAVNLDGLADIDLEDYDLGEYLYDEDQDGTYDITALHLFIYVHEKIMGLDWNRDLNVTGGPGSIYFEKGLFGFEDENLRYNYNGAYPADENGWGFTADRIVLSDGDFFEVAHYSDWSFFMDSAYGFHYFVDDNDEVTLAYEAEAGTPLSVKLSLVGGGLGSVSTTTPEAGYTVYYGKTVGDAAGEVTTDEDGTASITFSEAGTWYVWCDGGEGVDAACGAIVSSPACATVTVAKANEGTGEQVNPDQEATDEAAATGVETLIGLIGTVTIHSGEKIKAAGEAYDALTEAQKKLVDNYSVLTEAEDAVQALYAEAAKADHESIYHDTGSYLAGLETPIVGSVLGEWMVIDITRSGGVCPEGYYENVVTYVRENINTQEQLHSSKSTDNARVILGLTAAGYDVTDVDGHNLLMGLTDMPYVKKQGLNGPIWALIAFDSYQYDIPINPDASEQVTREGLISYILSKQHTDGGWSLMANPDIDSDPDMTGMAIQSLAPYYNTNAAVKVAVDKAVTYLSEIQFQNGGFAWSAEGSCSESCAQVIVALTALGINPETDERFIKNGMSVVDAMCIFAVEGGGFEHVPGGGLNGMATEQGQYALAAYYRFLNKQNSLYDMTDVTIGENPKVEIPAEDDPTPGQNGGQQSIGGTSGNNSSGNSSGTIASTGTGARAVAKSANIGLTADLTEEAQEVIDQIDTFVADVAADFPEDAADYTEEQMNSVVDAYKAYMALSDEERLAVEESESYGAFEEVLIKIADFHHYDEASGIDLRENGEDVLPWHIRMVIEPKEMTEQQSEDVYAALGEDSKVFTMNDISFINILDESEWHPEDIVKVKKPMVHIEDYKHAVIVHITDDNEIELIEGTVDGDTVSFHASSFSLYGIAGTNSDLFAAEEDGAAVWPWILAGIAALAVLGYLMHKRIRQRSAS